MDKKEIYQELEAVTHNMYNYQDQIMAIAAWIESNFEYKPITKTVPEDYIKVNAKHLKYLDGIEPPINPINMVSYLQRQFADISEDEALETVRYWVNKYRTIKSVCVECGKHYAGSPDADQISHGLCRNPECISKNINRR